MFMIKTAPQTQTGPAAEALRGMAQNAAACIGPLGATMPPQRDALPDFADTLAVLADGRKRALILADAWVRRTPTGTGSGDAVAAVLDCAGHFLDKAQSNYGTLPGGGLWLLGLARPLERLAEANPEQADCIRALIPALKMPLIHLVETTGLDAYDAYADIKAHLPNQFYSLRHFGLQASINCESPYIDLPQYGLHIEEGRLRSLYEAGITTPVEVGRDVLRAAGRLYLEAL